MSRVGSICEFGFTLLELLVVLAIAGLLLAIATPMIGRGYDSVLAGAVAREIATELRNVRRAAVSSSREQVFMIDVTNKQFQTSLDDRIHSVPEKLLVAADSTLIDRKLPALIEFRFFGDGSASGGNIHLRGVTRHYRIEVSWLSGMVRIYD